MFDAFLKPDELQEIAEKLGADVPFCLVGGTKYATGIGTKLQKCLIFGIAYCYLQT